LTDVVTIYFSVIFLKVTSSGKFEVYYLTG